MDTETLLPIVVALDDANNPADVINALLLGPFVAGQQPVARSTRLERVLPDAGLVPAGLGLTRVAIADSQRAILAEGPGWTLRSARWSDACATVTVVAETESLAEAVLAAATEGACAPLPADGSKIPVAYWHWSCSLGARRSSRDLASLDWPGIKANYPAASATALERLISMSARDYLTGRLILLHGPPGSGKTTFLRALASAWAPWCRTEVVVDPERLYGDSAYLTSVLLGRDYDEDDDTDAPRWRLFLLEDCDELIRTDAKKEVGQALARLLNVTDGLVGEGLKLLVAITTNEPLASLHPAVARPGRCLAEIHIGPLSRAEAIGWLGSSEGVPAEGATLAELYALRGRLGPVRATELRKAAGMYL